MLDGLLAQYGTVENVEQGKMVQHDPHLCKSPSAAPQLCPHRKKTSGMKPSFPVIGTGLKWFSLWTQACWQRWGHLSDGGVAWAISPPSPGLLLLAGKLKKTQLSLQAKKPSVVWGLLVDR